MTPDAVKPAEADVGEIAGNAPENGEELAPAPDAWGQGEDNFEALGDLYDAADRLWHTPTSKKAQLELRAATTTVRDAPPPFGFNADLWRKAGELGAGIGELLDRGGSDDEVQAAAEALRDVLVEHV